jgi:hypothetical protein
VIGDYLDHTLKNGSLRFTPGAPLACLLRLPFLLGPGLLWLDILRIRLPKKEKKEPSTSSFLANDDVQMTSAATPVKESKSTELKQAKDQPKRAFDI